MNLRPFEPLEVINSTVCSHARPSGGNAGYDGCMEYMQLYCAQHHRSITGELFSLLPPASCITLLYSTDHITSLLYGTSLSLSLSLSLCMCVYSMGCGGVSLHQLEGSSVLDREEVIPAELQ